MNPLAWVALVFLTCVAWVWIVDRVLSWMIRTAREFGSLSHDVHGDEGP